MRCVVHVRRSFDITGQHFVLRVYPEFRSEERRSENFTSTEMLVDRLASLGVEGLDPARSFPGGGSLDAMWTNIEVPQVTLEGFGKGANYASNRAKYAAA